MGGKTKNSLQDLRVALFHGVEHGFLGMYQGLERGGDVVTANVVQKLEVPGTIGIARFELPFVRFDVFRRSLQFVLHHFVPVSFQLVKVALQLKTVTFHTAKFRHRGEAVLRKHLRTFEENQISNIIRKTKGKRRLKFHQFYSAKKYPKGYA